MDLTRSNYQAWLVAVEDFPEHGTTRDQLIFLLRYAVLAPSSHNSQPWKFTVETDMILIFADDSRAVPIADPDGRLQRVALGAALENILIAADYFGFATETNYFPRGWGKGKPAALIHFVKKETGSRPAKHLIFAIPKRLSNRHPYRPDPLPVDFLEQVLSLSNDRVRISVVTNQERRERLADVVLTAREEEFEGRSFREELAAWKRTNWTRSPIGMPGFTMGFSTLLSFITNPVIRRKNVAKMTRKKDEAVLKQHTPAMVIISSREDSRELQVESGQVFERIALLAAEHTLDTNIMVPAITFGNYHQRVQEIIGSSYRPQLFFRIGYAVAPMEHSPRLTVAHVLMS